MMLNGLSENVTEKPTLEIAYNFKPRDLQRDEYMKDRLSSPDLNEFIKLEKQAEEIKKDLQKIIGFVEKILF